MLISAATKSKIIDLYKSGQSAMRIADSLRVSRPTVFRAVRAAGAGRTVEEAWVIRRQDKACGATLDGIDDAYGNWLCGFIDGEGCFMALVTKKGTFSARFDIQLRADDGAVLEEAHRKLGGTLERRAAYKSLKHPREASPYVKWYMSSLRDIAKLVLLIDKYGLRGKKRLVYAKWREVVTMLTTSQHTVGGKAEDVRRLCAEIRELKIYTKGSLDGVL